MKKQLKELLRAMASVAWRMGVVLAVIMICLALWSWMVPAKAETMYVNVGEHSCLNGRSRAGNGEVVARLQRGWEVEVIHQRNGWALIDGYSELGCCWVCMDYLSSEPLPKPGAFEPVDVRTTVGKLLVRQSPAGKAIDRIDRRGTRLTVLATVVHRDVSWAYLGDGRWVMWKFLEVSR